MSRPDHTYPRKRVSPYRSANWVDRWEEMTGVRPDAAEINARLKAKFLPRRKETK